MDQLIQRQYAIEKNMDPRGTKWGIGKVKGTSLFHVSVVEGNKNSSIPESLQSKFTNPTLAQKAIEKFLTEMWDKNDKEVQKNARKTGTE